jgi:hypothetical protein
MSTEQAKVVAVSENVIARGKKSPDKRLKGELEPEHMHRCVAVEPDTGCYLLGETSAEAVGAVHDARSESQFLPCACRLRCGSLHWPLWLSSRVGSTMSLSRSSPCGLSAGWRATSSVSWTDKLWLPSQPCPVNRDDLQSGQVTELGLEVYGFLRT